MHTVVVARTAQKELTRISKGDPKLGKQLIQAARALANDPRPNGCKKLAGELGYRIRVREYRILYTVNDETVTVLVYRFAKREAAYD